MALYLSDIAQLSSQLMCRFNAQTLASACLSLASIELNTGETFSLSQNGFHLTYDEVLDCVLQLHRI